MLIVSKSALQVLFFAKFRRFRISLLQKDYFDCVSRFLIARIIEIAKLEIKTLRNRKINAMESKHYSKVFLIAH